MSYLSVLNKEDENLISMIRVLREFFGNRATNADWQRQMESRAKGWSRPSFMRRLRVLKKRGWIRIVGGGGLGNKTLNGDFYETTDLAPGGSASSQYQNGVSDEKDLLEVAKRQLKSSAA